MARTIMIQGTASGVGKSIVTTGICRILKQDGYMTAPFKAQNMSNNAFITQDGLQMAKSQAIAAYACGIEPRPDMNPILLKILENGIEVILCGRSTGLMSSEAYKEYKQTLWPEILASYGRLTDAYDAVVSEGAGSPVEMNLKEHDVVNMGFALRTQTPVILVSDIDRGGVFASVKGTLSLLDEAERRLVKGIIINKCKGSKERFSEVKEAMEAACELPVIGMLPYMQLEIEDEDSLIDSATGVKPAQSLMHMNEQFDLLADQLRENLDMDGLRRILEGSTL